LQKVSTFLKLTIMARPVRETPILYGKDAKRFLERMKNPPKETPEEKKRRLEDYHLMMRVFVNK
jgi:hypothetical protein